MVCTCAMLSNCVWLQIIFCSCVNETTFFAFLRSLLRENGRSRRFPKIFLKKTNTVIEWWNNYPEVMCLFPVVKKRIESFLYYWNIYLLTILYKGQPMSSCGQTDSTQLANSSQLCCELLRQFARRLKFSLFQTLGSNFQEHAITCNNM